MIITIHMIKIGAIIEDTTRHRQHYIALLERILAISFRMFRNNTTTTELFNKTVSKLLHKSTIYANVLITSEYHRAMILYRDFLVRLISSSWDITIIREQQMTTLNRIQKLKNLGEYKRSNTKKITIND